MNDVELLGTDETNRIVDLARACKAAQRAVTLYPSSHPAIAATLARIVQTTSLAALGSPTRITVLPEEVRIDGRKPARDDEAVAAFARLLHEHLVGEILIHPGGDKEAWMAFLQLLGRPPDAIRAEGGIGRVWTTMAGRHVELREIDYSEVLREREGTLGSEWDDIISNCLEGTITLELDEEAMSALASLAGDGEKIAELMGAVETRVTGGIGAKSAAIMRMIRSVVTSVSAKLPDMVDSMLQNVASAVGQLTPELVMGLLAEDASSAQAGQDRVMDAVVSHMPDRAIASFVSRNVIAEGSPTERLAQAFSSLVNDTQHRERILSLAKDDVAASALGGSKEFDGIWTQVAQKLLTSYADKSFVSEAYARELSTARVHAIDVEKVGDDPPERISVWLGSVSTTVLRSLDISLLLDLLRLEQDDAQWGELMAPVVHTLEDLLLVGDFESAVGLVEVLANAASGKDTKGRRQHGLIGIDILLAGPMMQHIVIHLATVEEAQFERIKTMCLAIGEALVRPLAETIAGEQRSRTRERLIEILLAFGASAQRTIERLKSSPNAVVRRTAIQLMRQFGGTDALPELTELLDDNEPQVQREAVRAILNIGTDKAFQVLQQALATGSEHSRNAIMQSISLVRDDRATPLIAYIIRNVDHRRLTSVYLRAIEQLGTLRDPEAVAPLSEAFRRPGEWWAPRRTSMLRAASAAALARVGTPEAFAVLEDAVANGPRGLRNAARPHLQKRRRPAEGVA
jgi:HEAT repeat protein